jgi:hypothetical protein
MVTFVILLICSCAWADVSVVFPLQGHFRAGKHFPVNVRATGSSSGGSLTLRAEGAVPTEINWTEPSDVIVPWLAVRDVLSDAQLVSGSIPRSINAPLHALTDDQALVGFAGADPDVLKPLLTNRKIIGIPLDLGRPLAGPIAAWEALDGIVLDASSAARVTEAQLQGLLAAGTAVAIRSGTKPAGNWPWQRQGEYWTLHVTLAGPDTAYDAAAYAPTASWARGWPDDFRRLVLVGAVVFAIVTLAVTLWQSKLTLVAVLFMCSVTAAAAFLWRGRQPPSIHAAGEVMVLSADSTQHDRWTYRGVIRPAKQAHLFSSLTRPILGYRTQLEQTHLRLVCDADGQPQRFEFHLEPGWSLAFLTRSISPPHAQLAESNPVYSPLRTLAEDQYLRAGDRISGQLAAPAPDWPGVVIKKW